MDENAISVLLGWQDLSPDSRPRLCDEPRVSILVGPLAHDQSPAHPPRLPAALIGHGYRRPRFARSAPGGFVYHALNGATARLRLFRKDANDAAFLRVYTFLFPAKAACFDGMVKQALPLAP
jgi:hypothetical protein